MAPPPITPKLGPVALRLPLTDRARLRRLTCTTCHIEPVLPGTFTKAFSVRVPETNHSGTLREAIPVRLTPEVVHDPEVRLQGTGETCVGIALNP